MGNYKKVLTIPSRNLTNAEYQNFMNRTIGMAELKPIDDGPVVVSNIINSEGVPELGLTPEFLDTYKKDLAALADVVHESRISHETEEAARRESTRSNLVIYITTRISRAGTLQIKAESDAGKYLYKVIKPYIGIARLPSAQKTAAIEGMLIDLRKEVNAPYVSALGLETYMDELEKENNAFSDLISSRTQNRAANRKDSGAEIRKRLDEQYDDLVMLAQSYNVVKPTERSNTFIDNLNQLIRETITAYNVRGKAPRQKKEEGNLPIV